MTGHGGPVAVIGAGLSGLAAARTLRAAGVDVVVHEADDGVGGRVQTDEVDGFRLDRGFQVLLTGYPLASQLLDFRALDLRPFAAGALVWDGTRRQRLADPFRSPLRATLRTAIATIATPLDKLRLARFRLRLASTSGNDLLSGPERTTLEELQGEGFSEGFIDHFFRPFLGGVLLDPDLATSARAFRVIMRAFFTGDAAIPSLGMGAIPRQLAGDLDVRTGSRITDLAALDDADAVIVAVEAPAAAALLGRPSLDRGSKAAGTLYYASRTSPLDEPILVLDGTRRGPVTHVAVPSAVAPTYAPAGWHLIAANVTGEEAGQDVRSLDADVRSQLRLMLDTDPDQWLLLAGYDIPHGQPAQPTLAAPDIRVDDRIYLAGDHMAAASIEGALRAGVAASRALLADRGISPAPVHVEARLAA